MTPLTVTSVASAAIISGDLIIGLSDGSIINCGRAQGATGLDGPQGPIGAPGRPGKDGNTILTSEGLPRADVGVNGDYIIDKSQLDDLWPQSQRRLGYRHAACGATAKALAKSVI